MIFQITVNRARINTMDADLRKGHRSEVQMSVTYKSDMDLRIGRRLETGRQSESYIYIFRMQVLLKRMWLHINGKAIMEQLKSSLLS